jgi:hypothetical protein
MRAYLLSYLPLAIAFAAPAHAEVIQHSDSGFIVREVAEVPADNWASWAALTAPAKWWSPQHTWSGKAENLYIDSQATGCFCELMPVPEGAPEGTRRGSAEHMHIIQSAPGTMLRMSGALGPLQGEAVKGVLTITFKKAPKGTQIAWEYVVGGYMRFKPEQISKAVDGVMSEQLGRLAALLGGELVASAVPVPKAEAKSETPEEPKPETPSEAPKAEPAIVAEPVAGGAAEGEAKAKDGSPDIAAQFDAAVDKPPRAEPKTAPKASPKIVQKPKKPATKKPAAK